MYTISDILMDIDRGCLANNMIEDRFTYRYQMDKKQSKRLLWKIVHKLLNKMV